MNVQQAAAFSGLPAKTVRYYDDIGLVSPARGENRYRHYSETDAHKLRFLQRARGLGFSLDDCRQLLSLYENEDRASADVKALALKHMAEIDRKLEELKSLRRTLGALADACRGDARPDCPILDGLARGEAGGT